jgi:hypothetical protein
VRWSLWVAGCSTSGTDERDLVPPGNAPATESGGGTEGLIRWERNWERTLLAAARWCSAVLAPARFWPGPMGRAAGRGSGGDNPYKRGVTGSNPVAPTQVSALLVSSGEAWRRVSTSCQESAPGSDLAAFDEVSDGFGSICVAWVQATGSASPSWSRVRRPGPAVRCRSSGWSSARLKGRPWGRKWER